MVDTFTNNFDFTLPTTGGDSGTWGNIVNNTITSPLDAILGGTQGITLSSSNVTLTQTQWNNKAFKLTGSLLANVALILPLSVNAVGGTPAVGGEFIVDNETTGNFSVTVLTAATGSSGVTVPQGFRSNLYSDTVNVHYADDGLPKQPNFWSSLAPNQGLEIFTDGQGSVITTGQHGDLEVPFNCTITAWTATANPGGGANGIAYDVWRANGARPTSSAQSIVGGASLPGCGGGATYAHGTPAGWTSVSLVKADILVLNVSSSSGNLQSLFSLNVTRTAS